jgi:hypothetical protein
MCTRARPAPHSVAYAPSQATSKVRSGSQPASWASMSRARSAVVASPSLRRIRATTGSPIGIPPHTGVTRTDSTTTLSPSVYTTRLRVERTASRKLPAPSMRRPVLWNTVSSRSTTTAASGATQRATMTTVSERHSWSICHTPSRSRR